MTYASFTLGNQSSGKSGLAVSGGEGVGAPAIANWIQKQPARARGPRCSPEFGRSRL